jgi:D-amino-acid dehydrogenase
MDGVRQRRVAFAGGLCDLRASVLAMSRIAIIGGGIIGAAAAYRLVQRGAEVLWIDRTDPGQATAAGAGILPPSAHFGGNPELEALTALARRHYTELLATLARDGQDDTGYDVVGALHVATSPDELAQLQGVRADAERRRDAGLPHVGEVRELDGAAARRLFPALGERVLGAVHMSGAARVDGRRLLAALRAAALARGAQILAGSARPWLAGGVLRGVEVEQHRYESDAVIVAAGAWSRALGEQVGVELAVTPQRGQIAHLSLPGAHTGNWPIVLGFGTDYLLTFPEDRVVVGATRESDAGYDQRVTALGVQRILADALRVAPGLAQASLLEVRVGLRPLSRDGKPVLGASARVPNLFFATGHGGFGLELGPHSGALVAELSLGDAPPLDLTPFSADRFSASAPSLEDRHDVHRQ